jgi:hypothetical protein
MADLEVQGFGVGGGATIYAETAQMNTADPKLYEAQMGMQEPIQADIQPSISTTSTSIST